jgi:C-terminal processing protease CtpA/Prc
VSRCLLTLFALVALLAPAAAQQPPDKSAPALADAERKAVIDGVLERIAQNYVFPDVAKKMEAAVRDRQAKKEYDAVTTGHELAEALTKHLREVCKDKHLGVRYSPVPLPKDAGRRPAEEELKKRQQQLALRNYGFKKVERLGGGVGLLEFEVFMQPDEIGDTAAASMSFLANSEAVIVDLRKNGGGSPEGVILLCSYFFDQSVHLNSIYTRTTDTTRDYWSQSVVPGKKLAGKDVYVLTSGRTFSGAEEFAYNMQSQKKATIVGETTGGGAHPTRGFRVTDHFTVGVPFARSINPVTKTNWEGTGVKPDVPVPADHALHTAHLLALKKAAEKHAGDKEKAAAIRREVETVQKELDELKAKSKAASDAAPKFALGVMLDIGANGRVRIDGLVPGGAAEKGGLKVGDVLLKAGGKAFGPEPMSVLTPLLRTGEAIEVEVERDGKTQTITVRPAPRAE